MKRKITKFTKIFGSGPRGVLVSLILLAITAFIDQRIGSLKISDHQFVLNVVFVGVSLITVGLIVWSVKSLPASDRGNTLCVSGAFKYVRHPLYASFLSVFDFGLALYLNSYLFVLWAILLHPIWHYIVRYEENVMVDIFGGAYVEYRRKTGRFFPMLISTR
ncbi:MAG: isoprenylcysteine carboxylmethyltransferase family protein [bacterium]|nr:isoprenylcysteine carboxylmethyltransferase family protein [bacterium]